MEAVEYKRTRRIHQLAQLSDVVEHFRSAQSMEAGLTVSLEELEMSSGILPVREFTSDRSTMPQLQAILASDLGLLRPLPMPLEKYLSIVMPHKKSLIAIRQSLIKKTGAPSTTSLGMLHAKIAAVNDEIRTAQRSKRYKALKATVGIVKANPVLMGTLLLGEKWTPKFGQ